MKFFILLLLLMSNRSIAADRGLSFTIAERLLNLSGLSYVRLEKKISEHETARTKCENGHSQTQDQLKEREKDIRDCHAYESFKVPPQERSIGFNLMDIMSAGCKGHLKMTKERYGSNSSPEGKQVTEIDDEVESFKDNTFRNIALKKIKKSLDNSPFNRADSYRDRIDPYPFGGGHISESFPSIVIGRIYETKNERKGGTLEKGVYNLKYNVMKSSGGQLEITLEGDVAQQWNHMPIGEKYKYKLFCVGKSLDELNQMAEAAHKSPDTTEISKKVFGN